MRERAENVERRRVGVGGERERFALGGESCVSVSGGMWGWGRCMRPCQRMNASAARHNASGAVVWFVSVVVEVFMLRA
jgi:hypothetical protein